MATPHRVVDSVANGVADGAQGISDGILGALRNAGSAIMSGLDKPFMAVTGKEGCLITSLAAWPTALQGLSRMQLTRASSEVPGKPVSQSCRRLTNRLRRSAFRRTLSPVIPSCQSSAWAGRE